MESLSGARALVIGGSSGIGLATARALMAQGADITIASRSADKLRAAAETLGRVATMAMDVSTDQGVQEALADSGTWDHIAITAGGGVGDAVEAGVQGPVRNIPLEAAGRSFNVKFWGGYRIAALADLRPGGSLTFVTGVYSFKPMIGRAMPAVAGGALEALVRILALEFAPTRVNAIAPGLVDTTLWDRLPPDKKAELYRQIEATAPAGKAGRPEEIAAMILMCMQNTQITGSHIKCDGGLTLT